MIAGAVPPEQIAAHRAHLEKEILNLLRKKPSHTHYDQLTMFARALAFLKSVEDGEV